MSERPGWVDDIHPAVSPERRAAILATRQARAAELEAWSKGAGEEYLRQWKRKV